MSKPDKPPTVRVRMAPGKTMPAPPGIVIDSAVQILTPETVVEVLRDDRMTRRRIAMGDWLEVGGGPDDADAHERGHGPPAEEDTGELKMTPGHRAGVSRRVPPPGRGGEGEG